MTIRSQALSRMAAGVCAAVLAGGLAGFGVPEVAMGQPRCVEPGEDYRPMPWAQQMLAPDRVWPFTQGAGVTVAVLSSGVDADHPYLAGRVAAGYDAVARGGNADTDCRGLGTQVAGVIAAQPQPASGLAGVAPQVKILPVRVFPEDVSGPAIADPADLARGIRWAAERAEVIVVPIVAYTDHSSLHNAVTDALEQGVIVVAATGDLGRDSDGNPTPYPASYDGVIGVGAVDPAVGWWPDSGHGEFVDLVAPGVEVVTLQAGAGMVPVNGTGVAAGFVAGAAALLRASAPDAPVEELVRRLLVTATPAPDAAVSPVYGWGVVNPYAAVHDRLMAAEPVPMPSVTRPEPAPQPHWMDNRDPAILGALGAVVAMVVVVTTAMVLPRGRRRSWRPKIAPLPVGDREPEEPTPPRKLFDTVEP